MNLSHALGRWNFWADAFTLSYAQMMPNTTKVKVPADFESYRVTH